MPEAAGRAMAGLEFFAVLEAHRYDRHEHELRDAVPREDDEGVAPTVPARDQDLSLVVRIDESDKITQDDPVLVPQPRTRQHHGAEARIIDVERHPARDQVRRARLATQRGLKAGTQVHARRSAASISGQREVTPETWVQDLELDLSHGIFRR